MAARFSSLFDGRKFAAGRGFISLTISDYLAFYHEKCESPRRLAILFVPRVLHNPCLHATILLRLAIGSPAFTLGLWRTLLISKHSIDIQRGIEIGPGLVLPHPHNVTFGRGVKVGRDVTVLHNVTIGGVPGLSKDSPQMCPTIGDGVTIYPQSLLVGPITIGREAVIGAGSWVDRDVAAGQVHRGRSQFVADCDRVGDGGA